MRPSPVPTLVIAFLVVACTPATEAGATPSGQPGATPTRSAAPTATPAAPLGSGDCGTDPLSSPLPEPYRHAAPELEALIPQTIAGVGFSVESFRWEAGSPDILTPLVGKHPENMCYAYAMPVDPSQRPAGIAVYRIVGVPALQLRAAMLRSWHGLSVPPGEQTVGGKKVIMVQMTGSPMLCCSNGPEYLYSYGEALFVVLPADADAAATVLRALP